MKLVGNLGTDFRNCGHGPQEQAKKGTQKNTKKERKRKQLAK